MNRALVAVSMSLVACTASAQNAPLMPKERVQSSDIAALKKLDPGLLGALKATGLTLKPNKSCKVYAYNVRRPTSPENFPVINEPKYLVEDFSVRNVKSVYLFDVAMPASQSVLKYYYSDGDGFYGPVHKLKWGKGEVTGRTGYEMWMEADRKYPKSFAGLDDIGVDRRPALKLNDGAQEPKYVILPYAMSASEQSSVQNSCATEHRKAHGARDKLTCICVSS